MEAAAAPARAHPLGHWSCWEAPALPGTWNPALLIHLGQDQEQMGFFAALWEERVVPAGTGTAATHKVTELLIEPGPASECGAQEGSKWSNAGLGGSAEPSIPWEAAGRWLRSCEEQGSPVSGWFDASGVVLPCSSNVIWDGSGGCSVLSLIPAPPVAFPGLGLMYHPFPTAEKPSVFKFPAGRNAVMERLLVWCYLYLRGAAEHPSLQSQTQPRAVPGPPRRERGGFLGFALSESQLELGSNTRVHSCAQEAAGRLQSGAAHCCSTPVISPGL